METSLVRSSFDARPKKCRSAVTNGKRLHVVSPPDGKWSRRFRDVFEEILAGLPGPVAESQRQLARRCATISIACEKMEGKAAAGEQIDLALYGAMTSQLCRCLSRLGLKPASSEAEPALRNVTPPVSAEEDRLIKAYERMMKG
jgi:hypothetical protein